MSGGVLMVLKEGCNHFVKKKSFLFLHWSCTALPMYSLQDNLVQQENCTSISITPFGYIVMLDKRSQCLLFMASQYNYYTNNMVSKRFI